MDDGHFHPRWDSETPESNHLKSGVFDYVHSPTHMQDKIAATNLGWGGCRGEIVHSHAFSFFDSLNASTAYAEKRGFLLNDHKKNVFR